MNSYQKLKLKHKEREDELLSDVQTLIVGTIGQKESVIVKHNMRKIKEKALWFGGLEHEYVPDLDGVVCYDGIFNQIKPENDEKTA